MKILVTGSTGRVGSQLVMQLLARGDTVCGFDMCATDRRTTGYSEIVGTLDDVMAVEKAVNQVDAVVHLGAFMSWTAAERTTMFRSNVEGTRILLEAASEAGIKRFVFASSGEVYPENSPITLPITEQHPLNANSPYGMTKLLGEELVRFHQRARKMETVVLRFSHTQNASELLEEDSFFSGPRFFLKQKIRQQENFGNHALAKIFHDADPGCLAHVLTRDENGRAFQMHITDTRDMVKGLLLALEHPDAAGEIFNLGATEPVNFETLLEDMSGITGYPVVAVDTPGAGVYYQTANKKIREVLGYTPEWTIKRMLKEAQTARQKRQAG